MVLSSIEAKQMSPSLLELEVSVHSQPGSRIDSRYVWNDQMMGKGLPNVAHATDQFAINAHGTQVTESREREQTMVQVLEGKLAELKLQYEVLQAERHDILTKLLNLKENIRIFCRMRPFLPKDRWAELGPILIPEAAIIQTSRGGQRKRFHVDKAFPPNSSQDEVFFEIEPLVWAAIEGQNVCIFSYGQTGSGKTFTMEGTKEHPGIVPRALQKIFLEVSLDCTANFHITFSMLEIYKGQLRDLLVKSNGKMSQLGRNCSLSIQMGANGSVDIENLSQLPIKTMADSLRLYEKGTNVRSTSWTNSNEASSRSHCLVRILIEKGPDQRGIKSISKLWLIDLGGSERLLKTNAQGQTMEEGKAINMSLSALGDVISALTRKQPHVPYRNSKLTQLLQDSLARSSKTLMLVHISPNDDDLPETICSLGFATRARSIRIGGEPSSDAARHREAVIAKLVKGKQKSRL